MTSPPHSHLPQKLRVVTLDLAEDMVDDSNKMLYPTLYLALPVD